VPDRWVEVQIAGRVAAGAGESLPDAAAAVDKDFLKTPILGLVRVFISEMPFAKNPGGVTCIFQDLGQCNCLRIEALAFEDSVGHAILELMPTRKNRRASRRTRGGNVKVGEAHRFAL
jgi:hypothetical protein